MTGCATTYQAGASEGVVDVIAHRGASAYAPENTLASFALAIEKKADWFELDCTLTKDGEVFVIHDGNLDRTTDGTGPASDKTLAELKALDAGSWFDAAFADERLPTLAEALDLAKDRIGVYIEIKNSDDDGRLLNAILKLADKDQQRFRPAQRRKMMALIEQSESKNLELTRKVIALIRERHMERQVVIQSFTPICCAVAIEDAPEIRTEFLGSNDEANPSKWAAYVRWGYLIGAAGLNTNYDAVTPERLDEFHRDGKSVAAWTVDDPADMTRLAGWGVDRIITNKPDVCLEALGR